MSKRIAVLLTLGIFLAALADVSAQERGGRGGHRRPKEDNAPKVGQKAGAERARDRPGEIDDAHARQGLVRGAVQGAGAIDVWAPASRWLSTRGC